MRKSAVLTRIDTNFTLGYHTHTFIYQFYYMISIRKMTDSDFSLEDISCSTIRQERDSTEKSYMDLADEFDEEPEAITYHVTGECDCEHEVDALDKDRPWTEKELLEHLLIEKNMHYTEVGNAFGCHQETVKNWAGEDRFDITVIDNSERVSSKIVRIMHRQGVKRSEDLEDPSDLVEEIHKDSE